MYIVGEEEIEALAKVIRSKALFRYGVGKECDRFEERYAAYLGVKHFALGASGSNALAAALMAAGIGPGDEVLIPAHTYMATATAVLAAGAIPVIVDVDDSITIDPVAIENAIGPCTRAVIPVHMWGAACNMEAIMKIAAMRNLIVIEDSCQGVGGGYHGAKFGSIGHLGCFSFNFYKNMTCGEGGGVAVNDDRLAKRVRGAIDPCHFYWNGRDDGEKPFAGNGARASELMGAMLNVQLDRLDGMIGAMRAEKRQILSGTASLGNLGLKPTPMNSADDDCATHVMYSLALGRGRDALYHSVSQRDRRQDRAAYIYRVGPGADRCGRCAPGHESLSDGRQCAVPQDLLDGHVREVARNSQPDGDGADQSRA